MCASYQDDPTPALLRALRSAEPVRGLTHNFYRHPARFSPEFVRAAIETFTRPGDTVLDPFLGGGTSAVEALAAGRRFVGCDLNPLATFIARVKTTPLSARDVRAIERWASRLDLRVDGRVSPTTDLAEANNLPWWLKNVLHQALDSVRRMSGDVRQRFARCTLLRTAQWALDCRAEIPTVREFLATHRSHVNEMLVAAESYKIAAGPRKNVRLLTRNAAGLEHDGRLPGDWLPPKLILTSPPYPGVHILYHRWQVRGRRETAAPYWLAGCHDGHGASYYTFGDRKRMLDVYLSSARSCFKSVAALMDSKSLLLQLVAFPDSRDQLPAYLDAMREAGLTPADDIVGPGVHSSWRRVPNRKWYTAIGVSSCSSQEILLAHRKSR